MDDESQAELPEALVEQSARDDVMRDVEAARGTTVAERARILEHLCRMAAEQISQHLDPQKALDWQDPLSPETEALLARLRRAARDD